MPCVVHCILFTKQSTIVINITALQYELYGQKYNNNKA